MPKTRDDLLAESMYIHVHSSIPMGVLVKDKWSLRPIMVPSGENPGVELTSHQNPDLLATGFRLQYVNNLQIYFPRAM